MLILMHSIRVRTIVDTEGGDRSIIDHMEVIEVLQVRGTELADRLAREHTRTSDSPWRAAINYLSHPQHYLAHTDSEDTNVGNCS